MSRSYKKVPGKNTEGRNHLRFFKRQANKKVRKSKNIPSGSTYRKVYNTWYIRDGVFVFFSKSELEEYFGDESYKMKTK